MLKPKQTHLIVSLVVFIAILLILVFLAIFNIFTITSKDLTSALLTTDGIFIGFTISALGIYYSIPLRDEIKTALVKQGYYKQVSKNFIISVVGFSISMLSSIIIMCFSINNIFVNILTALEVSSFIASLVLLILTSINFFKIVTKN